MQSELFEECRKPEGYATLSGTDFLHHLCGCDFIFGKKNMGDNDLEHPTHFSLRHLFFLLEGKKFSFVLRS